MSVSPEIAELLRLRGRRYITTEAQLRELIRKQDGGARGHNNSILHSAVFHKFGAPVVADLLRLNADVNAHDEDGITTMHNALLYPQLEVVRFLCDAGAALNYHIASGVYNDFPGGTFFEWVWWLSACRWRPSQAALIECLQYFIEEHNAPLLDCYMAVTELEPLIAGTRTRIARCHAVCAILLHRRTTPLGRDVAGIVARLVWRTRRQPVWGGGNRNE